MQAIKGAGGIAILCMAASWGATCNKQKAAAAPNSRIANSTDARAALSWLPSDTETIIVANGPFSLPQSATGADNSPSHPISNHETLDSVQAIATALMTVPSGSLQQLSGQKAIFAIEGSRHFRPPPGLGEMVFEGCEIVEFDGDAGGVARPFVRDAQESGATFEKIEGQDVAVLQKKLEEDVWTIFVAFPKPNLAVVATNREYLREVLSRIAGRGGPRALPDDLPEWKYVDTKSASWALRHYDRAQSRFDPTSPFGGRKAANGPDEGAIGFAFNLRGDQSATVTYLSTSKDASRIMQTYLFPADGDPDAAKELKMEYVNVALGATQVTFSLKKSGAASYFTFVLMAALGHAIYL